jgi:O-antigen/teichoic acid export membrane protein
MFRYAWQPFFLQHAHDEDARPLFARIFTLFTAAALFIVLAVSFFAQEIVAIPLPGRGTLIPTAYWMGLVVVPIALVGYVFQGWYFNFAAGVYIERQTKYLVHCALSGSAVSLLINYLLVPRYGMVAASWSVTVAFAVMAGQLYYIVRRFYPVPYAWAPILKMCAVAALIFFAWQEMPGLQVWWIEGGLLVFYLGSLLALRIVSPERLGDLLGRVRRTA